MREGRRRTADKGTEPDSLTPSPLNGAEFCVAEGFSSLEGVMNFSPYTIASGHGYSKTIPQ
jgi:hypothetical protein